MIWLNTDQFSSVQTQLQQLHGHKLKTEISIRYCAELRDSEATVIEVSKIRQHCGCTTIIVGIHSRCGSKLPGGAFFKVSKVVKKIWPPTLSFILEEGVCLRVFAVSSWVSISLQTLFVSRFKISYTSLMRLVTSWRTSMLWELTSELRDVDISANRVNGMDETWLGTINQDESLEMLCFLQKCFNSGLFGIRDFEEISHKLLNYWCFFFCS